MRKKLTKISILMTIAALTAGNGGLGTGTLCVKAANEISNARSQKANYESKKKDAESILSELESKKGDVVEYIKSLDENLNELETRIGELEKDIETNESELSSTQETLEEAKATEAEQYETMKKRIQYMYENGNTQYLQILMSSNSIADFLNRSEYVKQISDYDKNMLTRYQKAKDDVQSAETTIANKSIELNNMNKELSSKKGTVEKLLEEKNAELAKYEDGISKTEKEIASYQASIQKEDNKIESLLASQRKQAEAEELKKQKEAVSKATASSGNSSKSSASSDSSGDNAEYSSKSSVSSSGFAWPVPASGRITCGFGTRIAPTAGASSYHHAIDIGAPSGSTIVATASGTVISAGWNGGYGNYIGISHGNGVYSYYGHCSRIDVSVGQSVSRGQAIGAVGSTGISTGPHLDFSINVNGSYVDPRNYVSY